MVTALVVRCIIATTRQHSLNVVLLYSRRNWFGMRINFIAMTTNQRTHGNSEIPVPNNTKSYQSNDQDCCSNGTAVANGSKPLHFVQYDNVAFQANNSADHHDVNMLWHGNHLYRSKSERQHGVAMRYHAASRSPNYASLDHHGSIETMPWHGKSSETIQFIRSGWCCNA